MAEVYEILASAIVKQQEQIVGPVAWSEARRVEGIVIESSSIKKINGDGKQVIESLVKQYATLFGRASIEACRDAVRSVVATLDKDQIPEILL